MTDDTRERPSEPRCPMCDGPVAYLRALLAQASGSDASSVFETALERSERAGLMACAAEIRRRSSKRSARGARVLSDNPVRLLAQATREPAE